MKNVILLLLTIVHAFVIQVGILSFKNIYVLIREGKKCHKRSNVNP